MAQKGRETCAHKGLRKNMAFDLKLIIFGRGGIGSMQVAGCVHQKMSHRELKSVPLYVGEGNMWLEFEEKKLCLCHPHDIPPKNASFVAFFLLPPSMSNFYYISTASFTNQPLLLKKKKKIIQHLLFLLGFILINYNQVLSFNKIYKLIFI